VLVGEYLIDTLGPTGYIYCSSNSITPNVKPENYRAMIETLWKRAKESKEWNRSLCTMRRS
jgi:hypothetical protein